MNLTWIGFLRRRAPVDSAAKLLLQLGGETFNQTLNKIESDFRFGIIDADSREHRISVLDQVRAEFEEAKPLVDVRDPKDWITLQGGAHMRKCHADPCGMEALRD